MACEALPRAFTSRNFPRLIKVRIMAASAKYIADIAACSVDGPKA